MIIIVCCLADDAGLFSSWLVLCGRDIKRVFFWVIQSTLNSVDASLRSNNSRVAYVALLKEEVMHTVLQRTAAPASQSYKNVLIKMDMDFLTLFLSNWDPPKLWRWTRSELKWTPKGQGFWRSFTTKGSGYWAFEKESWYRPEIYFID